MCTNNLGKNGDFWGIASERHLGADLASWSGGSEIGLSPAVPAFGGLLRDPIAGTKCMEIDRADMRFLEFLEFGNTLKASTRVYMYGYVRTCTNICSLACRCEELKICPVLKIIPVQKIM